MLLLALCLSVSDLSRLYLRTTDYMLFNCAQLGLTLKLCSLVITYQKERLRQDSVGPRSGSKLYFLTFLNILIPEGDNSCAFCAEILCDLKKKVGIFTFLPLWCGKMYCYIMLLIESSSLSFCQWILMECIGVLEWVGLLAIRHRENG